VVSEEFDFKKYLDDKRIQINHWLKDFVERRFVPENRLCQAMEYSLMAGGKRLRPVLCLASAEAVGSSDRPEVLAFAGAIEMIHTYSLIHDDLPAMDDDSLRRGQPTCHVRFDEATAILAGDGLLTLAFEVMSGACLEAGAGISAMHGISKACGFQGMIEGQMRDIEAEANPLALEDLTQMHRFKTGALIEAAVSSGGYLGGGTGAEVAALSEYARHIGLAFQVADDVLNVEGDPSLMGKAAGTDQDRRKSTYPGVMGVEASRAFARDLVEKALQALDVFDNKAKPLGALAKYIVERRR
jgi:geranylgeranyl diphosphate synthase type II